MNGKYSYVALLTTGLAGFGVGNRACAQSAEPTSVGTLEQVIVTAQKRGESVQDIPFSVAAIGADQMERAGVSSLESVALRVPGLTVASIGTGFATYTYLRGSGVNQIDAGGEPSIAVFVDEVYLGGMGGQQLDLVDVERVEILKGPQGSLFGRNTAGGAISVTTKRPARSPEGQLRAEVGNLSHYLLRGSVSGPLPSFDIPGELFYRLSAGVKRRDGVVENLAGPDPGESRGYSARGQLEWDMGPASLLLTVDGFVGRNGMSPMFISSASSAAVLSPEAVATLPPGESYYRHRYNVDGHEDQDTFLTSGRLEWDTSIGELVSISAYRYNKFDRLQDQDGTIKDAWVFQSHEANWTFSQEFRLSGDWNDRMHWLGGLYYYSADTINNWGLSFGPDYATPIVRNQSIIDNGRIQTESYAAFGQISADVTDAITLTLGGRYTFDEKSDHRFVKGALTTDFYEVNPNPDWSSFDPSASVSYQLTPDAMIYYSFRQGFKAGGFQSVNPATAEAANTPYDPERVRAHEIGLKSSWLENQLRLNIAAFSNRITDQQVTRSLPGQSTIIIDNAATMSARGIDISVTARPVPQLLLNADMTFQKAAFDRYRTATADYSGNRQLRSPDFAGSYSAEYTLEGPADSSVSMRAEYIYQSERFFDASNPRGAGQFAPGYGLLNARVTYRPPTESWYFAVWGKNLTDERYVRNIAFVPPTGITWPGDPLTFGLEFGTDF